MAGVIKAYPDVNAAPGEAEIITCTPTGIKRRMDAAANLQTGNSDVSDTNRVPVSLPAAQSDAFGRFRVSTPETLFDSKQLFDNQPLFWDDSEETGSGTTSTFSANNARSRLAVSASTAGLRTRQTFMRFNYQPGKSQPIFLTGVLNVTGGGAGITQCFGYYDDDNGIFLRNNEGTIEVVRRTNVTGSAVDNAVAQASWNLDVMDGTGASGVTIDWTTTQILLIDFEWLGVGRVRMGFVVDGNIYYAHEFNNANSLAEVYMSTPNLPLRYQIENDGTGGAASLDHICSTVISEGGLDLSGVTRGFSTAGTHVDANSANTLYAVVGIRLKAAYIGATIQLVASALISETNDDYELVVMFNPTVAGTFTYSDETNSALQFATGATANTVTGGTQIWSVFSKSASEVLAPLDNALRLGAAIDGTVDEVVLCVRPLSANADIQGSLMVREVI